MYIFSKHRCYKGSYRFLYDLSRLIDFRMSYICFMSLIWIFVGCMHDFTGFRKVKQSSFLQALFRFHMFCIVFFIIFCFRCHRLLTLYRGLYTYTHMYIHIYTQFFLSENMIYIGFGMLDAYFHRFYIGFCRFLFAL